MKSNNDTMYIWENSDHIGLLSAVDSIINSTDKTKGLLSDQIIKWSLFTHQNLLQMTLMPNKSQIITL